MSVDAVNKASLVRKLIIDRAGLSQAEVAAGKADPDFEAIVDALVDVHRGKEVLYGNYMETHGSEPENFCLIQHFCDTKRKYVRAENFVKLKADNKSVELVQLLDTYADMAVYSIMGVQMVMHLMNRKTAEIKKEVEGVRYEQSF